MLTITPGSFLALTVFEKLHQHRFDVLNDLGITCEDLARLDTLQAADVIALKGHDWRLPPETGSFDRQILKHREELERTRLMISLVQRGCPRRLIRRWFRVSSACYKELRRFCEPTRMPLEHHVLSNDELAQVIKAAKALCLPIDTSRRLHPQEALTLSYESELSIQRLAKVLPCLQ